MLLSIDKKYWLLCHKLMILLKQKWPINIEFPGLDMLHSYVCDKGTLICLYGLVSKWSKVLYIKFTLVNNVYTEKLFGWIRMFQVLWLIQKSVITMAPTEAKKGINFGSEYPVSSEIRVHKYHGFIDIEFLVLWKKKKSEILKFNMDKFLNFTNQ